MVFPSFYFSNFWPKQNYASYHVIGKPKKKKPLTRYAKIDEEEVKKFLLPNLSNYLSKLLNFQV